MQLTIEDPSEILRIVALRIVLLFDFNYCSSFMTIGNKLMMCLSKWWRDNVTRRFIYTALHFDSLTHAFCVCFCDILTYTVFEASGDEGMVFKISTIYVFNRLWIVIRAVNIPTFPGTIQPISVIIRDMASVYDRKQFPSWTCRSTTEQDLDWHWLQTTQNRIDENSTQVIFSSQKYFICAECIHCDGNTMSGLLPNF